MFVLAELCEGNAYLLDGWGKLWRITSGGLNAPEMSVVAYDVMGFRVVRDRSGRKRLEWKLIDGSWGGT